jgi:hypothetical protein
MTYEQKELCLTVTALFKYDPLTGDFHYRCNKGRAKAGSLAGCIHKSGYRHLKFQCRALKAHKVAWAIFYGEWPLSELDHINGIKADNRIANLRAATPSQNAANKSRRKDSRSPYKGVSPTPWGTWQAHVGLPGQSGKKQYLGTFPTPESARDAYAAAAAQAYGEFARIS